MSFHVPNKYRITPSQHPLLGSREEAGNNGAFTFDSPEPGWTLFLICSDGTEPESKTVEGLDCWEHVSVSVVRGKQYRVPTWKEMCFVKNLCWDEEDTIVQYHPKLSEYVNNHPGVLHLWRWKIRQFPTPPMIAVGIK